MNPVILQARDLHKDFRMGEISVQALRGIDFRLRPGEFVAVMGPSGSGKSTLLHILAGLENPSGGTVTLGEREYSQLRDQELTLLRRREIGVVFQFFNLLSNLSALENVLLPLLLDGQPMQKSRDRAQQALAWVGLSDREQHTPDRLSGGEQQRAALARAMVFQPSLLLADEPTGNLDRASGENILRLLRRAADELGQTVVMVTHDPVAASYADRVVFLADGLVVHEIEGDEINPEAIIRVQVPLKN